MMLKHTQKHVHYAAIYFLYIGNYIISQHSVTQQQTLCVDIPLTLVYRQLPAKRNLFERLKTISSGKCVLNMF